MITLGRPGGPFQANQRDQCIEWGRDFLARCQGHGTGFDAKSRAASPTTTPLSSRMRIFRFSDPLSPHNAYKTQGVPTSLTARSRTMKQFHILVLILAADGSCLAARAIRSQSFPAARDGLMTRVEQAVWIPGQFRRVPRLQNRPALPKAQRRMFRIPTVADCGPCPISTPHLPAGVRSGLEIAYREPNYHFPPRQLRRLLQIYRPRLVRRAT